MHPLAVELNEKIRAECPVLYELLSKRGRELYFPKGILSQSAEAKEKAHRFNATIGEATEGDGPMALDSVLSHVKDVSPTDAVRYAPAGGRNDLRQAWQKKQFAENPSMRGKALSLPIVTHALTHGLALAGDLFVDPGDRVLIPDMLWDNYALNFETRLGGKVETFPTYDGEHFNVPALRAALLAGPAKSLLVLNFPNNPTGYMPTPAEVAGMRDAIAAAGDAGRKLVVICDDAYFGLIFSDAASQESPFGLLANAHANVVCIKLDGATKELFVWGLRCGFLTVAPPPCSNPDALFAALERKLMGAIRASISNCTSLSQAIVLAALRSPTLPAERREKFEILRARAQRVREVVYREKYARHWDVYPFNAGYFMCIRVKGVPAEKLRLHLLEKYGIGVIAMGQSDIRVAFSCLELDQIEPLFESTAQAIAELRG
ncbi:MAG TPA: aminotransferase class I/II-fold pyridoxal phosphate-dependent enzyme [Myxococcota bacterium]|nr:aminotransferase class I/II-fold pyridoxal phosphate-dependent enzyme [Myxococcota bacterium]